MKVVYPGPKSKHFRRSSYFSAYAIVLKPGINEVSEEKGRRLLEAGLVEEYSEPSFEYKGPIPTEGEAVEPPKKRKRKLGGTQEVEDGES